MCCKEERKLFLKKRTSPLKAREKKKGNEHKGAAGLVPIGDGALTIARKRIAGSALAMPFPDRLNRRIQRQRTSMSDSPAARRPHDDEDEIFVQWSANDLPLDVLVCVVCKLKHDELKPLSHVSKNFREAVVVARRAHFNFTTPSRTRVWNPLNALNGDTEGVNGRFWPSTPDAPRITRKSRRRLTDGEIREVAVTLSSLFGDDEAESVAPRVPSKRILLCEDEFREDELCQAVVRQTL